MKRRKQPVPPAEVLEKNLAEVDEHVIESPEVYSVRSWRPGPAGSDEPCTEVHLLLRVTQEISVAIRLKSPRALDELVGVLLDYRNQVWPEQGS